MKLDAMKFLLVPTAEVGRDAASPDTTSGSRAFALDMETVPVPDAGMVVEPPSNLNVSPRQTGRPGSSRAFPVPFSGTPGGEGGAVAIPRDVQTPFGKTAGRTSDVALLVPTPEAAMPPGKPGGDSAAWLVAADVPDNRSIPTSPRKQVSAPGLSPTARSGGVGLVPARGRPPEPAARMPPGLPPMAAIVPAAEPVSARSVISEAPTVPVTPTPGVPPTSLPVPTATPPGPDLLAGSADTPAFPGRAVRSTTSSSVENSARSDTRPTVARAPVDQGGGQRPGPPALAEPFGPRWDARWAQKPPASPDPRPQRDSKEVRPTSPETSVRPGSPAQQFPAGGSAMATMPEARTVVADAPPSPREARSEPDVRGPARTSAMPRGPGEAPVAPPVPGPVEATRSGSTATTLGAGPGIPESISPLAVALADSAGADRSADTPRVAPDPGTARSDAARAPMQQIAEVVRRMPEGSFEVKLSPEELGRVRLTVTPSETGLAITIQAERSDTLELLRRYADTLIYDLAAEGFADTHLDFGRDTPQDRDTDLPKAEALPADPLADASDTLALPRTPLLPQGRSLDLRL